MTERYYHKNANELFNYYDLALITFTHMRLSVNNVIFPQGQAMNSTRISVLNCLLHIQTYYFKPYTTRLKYPIHLIEPRLPRTSPIHKLYQQVCVKDKMIIIGLKCNTRKKKNKKYFQVVVSIFKSFSHLILFKISH